MGASECTLVCSDCNRAFKENGIKKLPTVASSCVEYVYAECS